jgi:hypothetical protein
MYKGGELIANEDFKDILSIGFEFESVYLVKLTQQRDSNLLVNTDTTLINLNTDKIKKFDENNHIIMDEILEYTTESNEHSDFKILNDIAKSGFNDLTNEECDKFDNTTKKKYEFITLDGRVFNIEIFRNEIPSICNFSNIEWVVTYYQIISETNIILRTFFDACFNLLTSMNELIPIKGDLYNNTFNQHAKIGNIKPSRILYNKPGTNVFYLQSHDYDNGEVTNQRTIGTIGITPQMTFRCNIKNVVKIMKTITVTDTFRGKTISKLMSKYDNIVSIESCIREIIDEFNKTSIIIIPTDGPFFGYLFLIFYKLKAYIENIEKGGFTSYLKNFLPFMARTSNYVLFRKSLKILMKNYNLSLKDAEDLFLVIINYPEIIKKYIKFKNRIKALKIIKENNKDYGNPEKSFMTYFFYFIKKKSDWLYVNGFDNYTSNYNLENPDELLIENRHFFTELKNFAKKYCGISLDGDITVNQITKLYNECLKRKLLTPLYEKSKNMPQLKTAKIIREKTKRKSRKLKH